MALKEPRGFQQAKAQAQAYTQDKKKTRTLVKDVLTKAYKNRRQLGKIWTDLMALSRLIKAWSRGDYKSLSRKTIVLAIAAAIYFLNPFDIVPDFIAGIGYLDDAAVIGFVLNSVRNDVEKFLEWENTIRLRAS